MEYPTENISIEILELKEDSIKFILNNVDASFANALRRIMISEVPTMAIEFVNIHNNMSSIHDEFLSQRIGLVPLTSHNIDRYQYFMDCKFCQGGIGCDYCSVRLTLKVTNNDKEVIDFTSMDIKSDSNDVKPAKFYSVINKDEDGNAKEIGILIGKLKQGQEVDVECIARKGIGKDHTKFSPVAVANFQYEPQIELNQQIIQNVTKEQKVAFVNSCPTNVYELSHNDEIVIANHMKCMFCDECVRIGESWKKELPPVKVLQKKFKFIFTVETTGSLKPEDIVRHAFNELRGKLSVIKEKCEQMRNPSYLTSNR